MKSIKTIWILAVVITLSSMVYQRMTGPTYPLRGGGSIGDTEISYELPRSHPGITDCEVAIEIEDTNISGTLSYKRYKTNDDWTEITMERTETGLKGFLPHQPPAGKLMYKIIFNRNSDSITLPENQPVVIRFRGAVPAFVLGPHVFFMFFAMLIGTKAGLDALYKMSTMKVYTYWVAGLLFLGGMILGPLVQKFAFGEYWTGVPFGIDLTDNKTLIAMIGWIIALAACWRDKNVRGWIIFAAIVQLIIFAIPHSVLGSELDYSTLEQSTGM